MYFNWNKGTTKDKYEPRDNKLYVSSGLYRYQHNPWQKYRNISRLQKHCDFLHQSSSMPLISDHGLQTLSFILGQQKMLFLMFD